MVQSRTRWRGASGQAGLKNQPAEASGPPGGRRFQAPGRVGDAAGARRGRAAPASSTVCARAAPPAAAQGELELRDRVVGVACTRNRTRSARRSGTAIGPAGDLGAVSAFRGTRRYKCGPWLAAERLRPRSLRSAGGRPPAFCRGPSESAPCVPVRSRFRLECPFRWRRLPLYEDAVPGSSTVQRRRAAMPVIRDMTIGPHPPGPAVSPVAQTSGWTCVCGELQPAG